MRAEARWLGKFLGALDPEDLGVVLSVGSGTPTVRNTLQPWIGSSVFDPLAHRGVRVLHHELEPGEGIDVAGDLMDETVISQLRQLGVHTVLCLNVLEHVRDPRALATSLLATVAEGGRVVFTVPRRFPYHPDPLDSMLRPTPDQLQDLLPTSARVEGKGSIRCESLALHWVLKPRRLAVVAKAVRLAMHGTGPATSSQASGRRSGFGETLRMACLSTESTYAVARNGGQ